MRTVIVSVANSTASVLVFKLTRGGVKGASATIANGSGIGDRPLLVPWTRAMLGLSAVI
jgi:hypothetical protein